MQLFNELWQISKVVCVQREVQVSVHDVDVRPLGVVGDASGQGPVVNLWRKIRLYLETVENESMNLSEVYKKKWFRYENSKKELMNLS